MASRAQPLFSLHHTKARRGLVFYTVRAQFRRGQFLAMTGLSGITGKAISRKGEQRYAVQWPARFFLDDKVIKQTTICAVFKGGLCIRVDQTIALGKEMHIEFRAKSAQTAHKIRLKAKIDYCLLRDVGVELDLLTTAIGREDHHKLANIIQSLANAGK